MPKKAKFGECKKLTDRRTDGQMDSWCSLKVSAQVRATIKHAKTTPARPKTHHISYNLIHTK